MSANPSFLCAVVAASIMVGGCSPPVADSGTPVSKVPGGCPPVETRAPNAAGQEPAFPGQTRGCAAPSATKFNVTVVATGLDHPWAVEPLPDGSLLVTERAGRMRVVSAGGAVGVPLEGLPAVSAKGQGGLLDVALSPDFATDRMIFWSYAEPRSGGNATSVARGVLSPDQRRVDDVRVIFRAQPTYDGNLHFGSRLAFGPDGMLFVTLGERSDREMRPQAQQLGSHMGKVLRITRDGAVPPGNPFVNTAGALPEIWSLGHRNTQAAAIDPTGRLWTVDHGPRGGDELNLIVSGNNYGWPLVTYGEEYTGMAISGAATSREGYAQPVYYWDPVIAPSGAQFHSGRGFPEWKGNLFVGGLGAGALVRLVITNDRVSGEEHLLTDRRQRVRDVREGAGGALYVVTDEARGELWRIAP